MEFSVALFILNVIIFLIQSVRNSVFWQCLLTLSKAGNITYVLTLSFLADLGWEVRMLPPEFKYVSSKEGGETVFSIQPDFKLFMKLNSKVKRIFRPMFYLNREAFNGGQSAIFLLGENDGPMKDDRGHPSLESIFVKMRSDYIIEECLGLVGENRSAPLETDIWHKRQCTLTNSDSRYEAKNVDGMMFSFSFSQNVRGCDAFSYRLGSRRYILTLNQVVMLAKLCQSRIYVQRKGRFFKKVILKEISLKSAFKLVLMNKMAFLISDNSKGWMPGAVIKNFKRDSIITHFKDEEKRTGLPTYLGLLSLAFSTYTGIRFTFVVTSIILVVNLFNELFMMVYNPIIEFLAISIKVLMFKALRFNSACKILDTAQNLSTIWGYCDKVNGVKFIKEGSIIVNPLGEVTFLERLEDRELYRLSKIKRSFQKIQKCYQKSANGMSYDHNHRETYFVETSDYSGGKRISSLTINPEIELEEPHFVKSVDVTIVWDLKGESTFRRFTVPEEFLGVVCILSSSVKEGNDSTKFSFQLDIDTSNKNYSDFELYLRKMSTCCVNYEQQIGYIDSKVIHYQNMKLMEVANDLHAYRNKKPILPLGENKAEALCELLRYLLGPGSGLISFELSEYITNRFKAKEGGDPFKDIKKVFRKMGVYKSNSYGNTDWKKITYFLSRIVYKRTGAVIHRITCPYLSKQDKQDLDRLLKCCDMASTDPEKADLKAETDELERFIEEERAKSLSSLSSPMESKEKRLSMSDTFRELEVMKETAKKPVEIKLSVDKGKMKVLEEKIEMEVRVEIEKQNMIIISHEVSEKAKTVTLGFGELGDSPKEGEGGDKFLIELSYLLYQKSDIMKETKEIYQPKVMERISQITGLKDKEKEMDSLNKQLYFINNIRSSISEVSRALKKERIDYVIDLMNPDESKFSPKQIEFLLFIAKSQIIINGEKKEINPDKYRTRASGSKGRLGHIRSGGEGSSKRVEWLEGIMNYCRQRSTDPNSIIRSCHEKRAKRMGEKLEKATSMMKLYRTGSNLSKEEINLHGRYLDMGYRIEEKELFEALKVIESNGKSLEILKGEEGWSNRENYSKELIKMTQESMEWLRLEDERLREEERRIKIETAKENIAQLKEGLKSNPINKIHLIEGNFIKCEAKENKGMGLFKRGFYIRNEEAESPITYKNYYSLLQTLENKSIELGVKFASEAKRTVFDIEDNIKSLNRSLKEPTNNRKDLRKRRKGDKRKSKGKVLKSARERYKAQNSRHALERLDRLDVKLLNQKLMDRSKNMTESKVRTMANISKESGKLSELMIKNVTELLREFKNEECIKAKAGIARRMNSVVVNYIDEEARFKKNCSCFFRWIKKEGHYYKRRTTEIFEWMDWLTESKELYIKMPGDGVKGALNEQNETRD
jgi:hypothetical protein